MRKLFIPVLCLACGLVAVLALFGQAPAAPVVKMAWQMPSASFAFRSAALTAYPVGASDFEVPLKVSYLADLDVYVWQFKAAIPAQYQVGDWVVYGQGAGQVVAFRFQLSDGAIGKLQPVPFPKPVLAQGQTLSTLTIDAPAVDPSAIVRFEMLRDGQVILSQPGSIPTAGPAMPHTFLLRGVLVGGPKDHFILSDAAEVTFDLGDRT